MYNSKLAMQYKSETGRKPAKTHETKLMNENIDPEFLQDLEKDEIVSLMKFEKAKWGCFLQDLPENFNLNFDLELPNPEYIEWLEEKLIQTL